MRRTTTVRASNREIRRGATGQPSVVRRLRAGLALAGIMLVAAGTQVIPAVPPPPVDVAQVTSTLPGAPFQARIEANRGRVAVAVKAAAASDDPERIAAYQSILDDDRQLLYFDPDANDRRGAWVELVGTIDARTRAVGIIVPGSSAYIIDDNFEKYYRRAFSFVEQGNGIMAMVVWAGGSFPRGWLEGALTRYHAPLGRALARFSHDLQWEIDRALGPGAKVRVVVLGHSFGGAVVGSAERYGLAADAVLHVASAGVSKVRDPYDYVYPARPRYSITAPGDLIGLVQGLPLPPGLGNGPDPDEFRCVLRLPTGRLPEDPTALDEDFDPLGDRAGSAIDGISSHSDVFIRRSDAWWTMYRVFSGAVVVPAECPPPAEPEPLRARPLPLAVPRVVTASQCRAGSGLWPPAGGGRRGDRHRAD